MNRRSALKLGTMMMAAAASPLRLVAAEQPAIKRVLVVFKCHLDVGFTLTQEQVIRQYLQQHYPAAMRTAAAMRDQGGDRYIWTTGSWMLYEYFERSDAAQRAAMERAIAHGDIAYHALPFTWQTEMLDRSMISGGLGFAQELDRRFGFKTIGAKMTDVPGHTRGLIAPLEAAGIQLLDIGVNAASTPPDVPEAFVWKDSAGNSVIVLYHLHDYGGTIRIPGSDLIIAVEMRGDNEGPHTPEQIAEVYTRLRSKFPGSDVRAANLNEIAHAVSPYKDSLPVITSEIGDTWIHGLPSDPLKVARFREIARLRSKWLADRRFSIADAIDRRLLRHLLLGAEHTWGTDTKTYLDYQHYRPAEIEQVMSTRPYQTMLTSWQEKRDDLDRGVESLPAELQAQVKAQIATLMPTRPSFDRLEPLPEGALRTEHFSLVIDPMSGAITEFQSFGQAGAQTSWASPHAPFAQFVYETMNEQEFTDFRARYIKSTADWAAKDFGKPGIGRYGAKRCEWMPQLVRSGWKHEAGGQRVCLELAIRDDAALKSGNVAWPEQIFLELFFPIERPAVQIRLSTFSKRANRLPEAMWLSFTPPGITLDRCRLTKSGEQIVASDIVPGGNRAMHAISDQVVCRTDNGRSLTITSFDAPVVAIGTRSPLNFGRTQPYPEGGLHFSLFNNAWGTNYPQWANGDWLYRFEVTV